MLRPLPIPMLATLPLLFGAPICVAHAAGGANCDALIDAQTKAATTPKHMYITETAAYKNHRITHSEAIETAGMRYLQVGGKWSSYPYDGKQEAADTAQAWKEENVKMTCTRTGDEAVDGQPAALYRVHQTSDAATVDTQIWIASGSGLPLRQTVDMDVGGKLGKSHREIRYDYANVQPPAP
ncbi:MAG: hypothetical protein QM741_16195 [Rudaea sp.]|uniref:hypothetical protein n=1 Tax=Rudaea sp. TaxID=2136325 RepID=UPI0039E35BC5